MEERKKRTSLRWRAVALLALGIVVGIAMTAMPATAHLTSSFPHLMKHMKKAFFTKKVADTRFINVGEKATSAAQADNATSAQNADKLGGLDSSVFARVSNVYSKTESDARYLGKTTKAADSELLDGLDSSIFARVANVYSKAESDARFLGRMATAVDSDKVDGVHANQLRPVFTRVDSTVVLQGAAGSTATGTTSCPSGQYAVSGGAEGWTSVAIGRSDQVGTSAWRIYLSRITTIGNPNTITIFVICVSNFSLGTAASATSSSEGADGFYADGTLRD